MIIPLGPGSLRDSSSLPEGQSSALLRTRCIRAGPALPSYLALLHAGFSVPRVSPPGRWALTPPFHPCQMRSTERGEPAVLPWTCRRVRITPAVYFLWHFPWPRLRVSPSRNARRNPLALPGALPFRRGSCEVAAMGVRTFLPVAVSSCDEFGQPAIIQLTRRNNYTACAREWVGGNASRIVDAAVE
jgi:hypothetical protein